MLTQEGGVPVAEVVHVAREFHLVTGHGQRVALCGVLMQDNLSWPNVVERFDLDWLDPAEREGVVGLITCTACKAVLAQEALEGAHG